MPLERRECLAEVVRCRTVGHPARRRGVSDLRIVVLRLRLRGADDGAQSVLRAAELAQLLFERGSFFRHREDLLLLYAVRLAQLCRLRLMTVRVHERVD